jgi:predicted Rossmann-fold nucleotide-binding protein
MRIFHDGLNSFYRRGRPNADPAKCCRWSDGQWTPAIEIRLRRHYLAKALVIFPGGYGTVDELFEVLTLIQTRKPRKVMPLVLFGSEYWDEVINFDAFVRWGTISKKDLDIFHKTDAVDDAYKYLTTRLEALYATPEGLDQVKLT